MAENVVPVRTSSAIYLVIAVIAIAGLTHIIGSLRSLSRLPESLCWAGQRSEPFPKTRACLRQLIMGLKSLDLGYAQYSRKGKPFVMPGLGFGPVVIIPQEHIPWLIAQPDNILSARVPQGDRIGIKYTMPMLDFRHDMFQIDIRKVLTPNLDKLQEGILEELRQNIAVAFGNDHASWREVPLSRTMESIMFSSLNRIAVGQPLCSNDSYLKCLSNLMSWMGGSGLVVGQLMPPVLKPVLGYLAALPIHYYKSRCLSFLVPVIKARMSDHKRKQHDPTFDFDEPRTLLSWMAAGSIQGNDTRDLTPEAVAMNILFLSLAGIFPTILTSTNNFLDILTSNPSHCTYHKIYREAADVFRTQEDWKDYSSLARLTLTDSAIKETLRRSALLSRGLVREVVKKSGIDLPNGYHLPQGVWLGVAIDSIHHDRGFYDDPYLYDAFRFVKQERQSDKNAVTDISTHKAEASRRHQGMATASDTYLPWGYGRHACPGRWFVAQQLKLLLAYVALNYDIQPLQGRRPPARVIGDSMVPPRDTVIKVRRRKDS